VTSFAGVFFNSSPGNDYSIGKLTENNVGFLQIRNANSGAELLRMNASGEAIFRGKTNIVKSISDYAFTITNTDSDGYGMYIQAGSTNNAIDVYNAAGTTQLFKLTGAGAATFSSSVTATQFTSQGGRGTSYGYKLPDWQIYNTTSGNALAFSNYTTDFLYINSSGNVGIGTTSPSRALTVASDTSFYNGAAGTGAIDPGAQEVLTAGFNVAGQSSLDISNIGVTLNRWKAIVRGGFANNNEGGGLVSSGLEIEVDSNSPSIPVGSSSITFSRNSSTGKLQVTNNNTSNLRTTFVGTIQIINYPQSAPPTISKVILGNVGINTTSPGNFNGLSFAGPFLDVAGIMQIKGTSSNTIAGLQLGGDTYRKAIIYSSVGTDDPYFAIGVSSAGSSSSASERMRITSGGRVGIGTTSPTSILNISGVNADAAIDWTNTTASTGRSYRWVSLNSGGFAIEDLTASGAERMRITSEGYVGITVTGTTVTSGDLLGCLAFVSKDASTYSSGGITNIRSYATSTYNTGNVSGDLRFYVSNGLQNTTASYLFGTEAMRITSGGIVYINATSNPTPGNAAPQFGVVGAAGTDAVNIKHDQDANNTVNIWQIGTTSHNAIAFYKGDTQINRGLITVTTSGTTYNSVSDYRLKENVTPLENGLDRLMQLKPSKFNWIETGNESEGFIAHELQEYFPDAVTGEKDAVYSSTGNIKPQSVDYGRITPLLVKALQELKAEFDEYKLTHP